MNEFNLSGRILLLGIAALLFSAGHGIASEPIKSAKSGFIAKAGRIKILEFKKSQAVCHARIIKPSGDKTDVAATTYFAGDYGNLVKVGIAKLEDKFVISVEVSNESTYLSSPYKFSFDARGGTEEFVAERNLTFSDSEWTRVYGYSEQFPRSEMRVELRACKGGKRVGSND